MFLGTKFDLHQLGLPLVERRFFKIIFWKLKEGFILRYLFLHWYGLLIECVFSRKFDDDKDNDIVDF